LNQLVVAQWFARWPNEGASTKAQLGRLAGKPLCSQDRKVTSDNIAYALPSSTSDFNGLTAGGKPLVG
jgi:hypothetical protein